MVVNCCKKSNMRETETGYEVSSEPGPCNYSGSKSGDQVFVTVGTFVAGGQL